MIYRTTLKAGQFNNFNGQGRYFYLLTAADAVMFKFMNKDGTIQFQSEFREGMSLTFPGNVYSVLIETETAQFIEFWLGDSKLDYMSLAAGGASAGIQAGRSWAPLGAAKCIPADFRRKKITITPETDKINVGGVDISSTNSWPLLVGEQLEMGTRGDIYTYLKAMQVNQFTGTFETWGNAGYNFGVILDDATGNIAQISDAIYYSEDDGVTFAAANMNGMTGIDDQQWSYMGYAGGKHYLLAKNGAVAGKVITSADSFKSWKIHANARIYFNGYTTIYCGWVSPDGKKLVVVGRGNSNSYYGELVVQVSENGFLNYDIIHGSYNSSYGNSNVYGVSPDKLIIRDATDGAILIDLDKKTMVNTLSERLLSMVTTPHGIFALTDNNVLYRSIDGGNSFDIEVNAALTAFNPDGMVAIGNSLVFCKTKNLALVPNWSESTELIQIATGQTESVTNVLDTNQHMLMFVNNGWLYFAPYAGVAANPMFSKLELASLDEGATRPAILKWLAEIN